MPTLAARDGELAYEARLATPNLSMLDPARGLLDRMIEQLGPFRAQLSDLRVETASPDLSRAHFACGVMSNSGIVRVFADRIEVRAADAPANENLLAIAEAAARAVGLAQGATAPLLAQHSFALAVHCEPAGITSEEFLAGLATSRPLEGEHPVSRSASFTFGQQGGRLSAFVGAEPSALITGGVFLRLVATYDARSLSLRESAKHAIALLGLIQENVLGVTITDVEFSAN